MAIMVNGRFQCLGSVQHLKNRYKFTADLTNVFIRYLSVTYMITLNV